VDPWLPLAAGDPGWPGFETGATRLFDVAPSVPDYPEPVSRQIWADPPDVLDLVGTSEDHPPAGSRSGSRSADPVASQRPDPERIKASR